MRKTLFFRESFAISKVEYNSLAEKINFKKVKFSNHLLAKMSQLLTCLQEPTEIIYFLKTYEIVQVNDIYL